MVNLCSFSTFFVLVLVAYSTLHSVDAFVLEEATVQSIRQAFQSNQLTSRQLVDYYIGRIGKLNSTLHGVIEINPDAQNQATTADEQRTNNNPIAENILHGIPILLKDNIATKDKLNTTAGSYALLGSEVPRDAGVVAKLRNQGAIILGKASLSEWSGFRSPKVPIGWSARGGQGINPYKKSGFVCGSSSGPAISASANMVTVALGTETDSSILCPASYNGVVGIKPTVGLTSRAGVVPISQRQDTVGPICRTVSDAVHVLDAIVGYDENDKGATNQSKQYIPRNGYAQYLKVKGLEGKKIGVLRDFGFMNYSANDPLNATFEGHLQTLRKQGATLVDNLEIPTLQTLFYYQLQQTELIAVKAEFKTAINTYLKGLKNSAVADLKAIIEFNKEHDHLEKTTKYGQNLLEEAEKTNGIGNLEREALANMTVWSKDGFEKLMKEKQLDALLVNGPDFSTPLAIGGFPAIIVPAGKISTGESIGLCFGGLIGTEPKLIEIAYGFEQATEVRKPPPEWPLQSTVSLMSSNELLTSA